MLQKPTENQILLITFLLLFIVIFGWNNVLELRAEEPRRAIVSIEMLLRGEYLIPQIHNWGYYNKPPVFNWCMLFFLNIFGSFDEWVVRLPSLLSYFATALLIFITVKRFLTKGVALFSSLFFLTTADILFYGTVNAGEIDLFFTLVVFGQVMSIFVFYERKQFFLMFFLSYLFAAIGTLTKGPPSIAFQGLTLLPWLLLNRRWRLLFNWKHFLSIAVFITIVGGYFFQYSKYNDAIGFMVRLFKEASQRSGMEQNIWDTIKESAFFPLYLAQLMLPWTLLVFFFFRKKFISVIKSNAILHFSLIFIIFNIPIYWFTADHKARYLYPFFPFFCILFSYFFVNAPTYLQKSKKRILLFLWE
ncbi:MAG: 4-amino-4-deoxy-L-arabinose transferase-like glycosyltransferase [Flavobacteriales bacterium]|jgi:4-amino-4-deoxy-L-arabinose transferase-like glycosyltransferase